MSNRDFPEGTAVVVGGSGGIGGEICELLAERGSDVVVGYRGGRDQAERVADRVRGAGRRGEAIRLPLEEKANLSQALEHVAESLGPLHTVVYAAGPDFPQRYVSDIEPARWSEAIRTECEGFFQLVQTALPHLRKSRGSLVALSTVALALYPPRDALSAGPKAAVEALVRAVAREEGRYGVRANCVRPGVIEAGIFRRGEAAGYFTPEVKAQMKKATSLRRFGSAREVAEVVAFLASSRAGYVTGQALAVDGGYAV